jgi:hypothetical protein
MPSSAGHFPAPPVGDAVGLGVYPGVVALLVVTKQRDSEGSAPRW